MEKQNSNYVINPKEDGAGQNEKEAKPIKPTGIIKSATKTTDSNPVTYQDASPPPAPAPSTQAPAAPAAASGSSAVTSDVNAEQETVESRLNSLTAGGSAYINQARKDAERSANTRGLINSSIAAGAGQEAAIRNALPIAQQDAKTYTDTRIANQNAENEFGLNLQSADLNMQRDTHNTMLNEHMAQLESSLRMTEEQWSVNLKTEAERILNDTKFSDEVKLQYVSTINNILRDTQDQIVQIGMSDRSADQQAQAIDLVQQNRDAEIAVYQELLNNFSDWEWTGDFTPARTAPITPIPEGAVSDGQGGYYWPDRSDSNSGSGYVNMNWQD